MKIKEIVTGKVRTIRVGMRAALILSPNQARNDTRGNAIDVATRAEGTIDVITARDLIPGTVLYILDPGSWDAKAERWACWANVVLVPEPRTRILRGGE